MSLRSISALRPAPVLTCAIVPHHLKHLDGVESTTSLMRPAYLMKLDPHLSCRNALERAQRDGEAFCTSEYTAFAAAYDLTSAFKVLYSLESRTLENRFFLDSRVSEVLQQALRERDRIRQAEAWYATEDARNLQRMKTDLARGWSKEGDPVQSDIDNSIASSCLGTVVKDFAIDQKAEDLEPAALDVYLPVLFDDTSRATAWKVGRQAREVAMHIATKLCGTPANVYEYRRSAHRVRGVACPQISSELCDQRLKQWTQDWISGMTESTKFDAPSRWRLAIMRVLLNEMRSEDMPLPTGDLVRGAVTGSSATTWDAVHLNAQYQAAYYSLRMLKQVLRFVNSIKSGHSDKTAVEALNLLQSFPIVADFCQLQRSNKNEDCEWDMAVQEMLDDCHVPQEVENTKESDDRKRSRGARKKRQKVDQRQSPRNAFAFLDDGEEA